jgi:hypothetical protein
MSQECSVYGESRGAYSALVGTLEGKRPLGRPNRRWKDIIKTDLQEVGLFGNGLGSFWLRIGTGAELFLIGKEPSGSVKWAVP